MKDRYIWAITGVVVAAVLGMTVWASAKEIRTGLERGSGQRLVQAGNRSPSLPARDPSKLTAGHSPYEGKKDAPVTMIECSDFQCPFCARFVHDTLSQLRKHEIKNGKVKLVFKNFPLPFHQYAEKAAEAAECAYRQGKFWQMHNRLFDSGGSLDTHSLESYAKQIGLNTKTFDHCLQTGETAGTVRTDKSACRAAGVNGTPTFFINGKMLVGAQPYEQFKSMIEQAEK